MADLIFPVGTTGLSGLYAKQLSSGTLGSEIPLSELSGAGGTYSATVPDGGEVFLVFDSADEMIAISDGAFGAGDRADLQRLKQLAEADESITPERYQKLEAGTATVILDKDATDDGEGTITLVEHTP